MYAHAQSPVRIGIAGGGTDLPAWTKEQTGFCLSLAIKLYTHAFGITRPDHMVVASYSHLDRAQYVTEIGNGLVRESAILHGWESGFEIHTSSEITSHGSGLGTSSSIAVSLGAVFHRMAAMRYKIDPEIRNEKNLREHLAENAWIVEIDRLRRPIGRQDHMAAVWGGLRLYAFEEDTARIERTFSEKEANWVSRYLTLIPLEEGRDARTILSNVRIPNQLQTSFDAVPIAIKAIEKCDPVGLGQALGMCQTSKMTIPGAVPEWLTTKVNQINAMPGVYGCKVAGAGGGGHLVVVREPNSLDSFQTKDVEPDFKGVQSDGRE